MSSVKDSGAGTGSGALRTIQCAVCSVQNKVCNVQCAVCNVQCAVCTVYCRVGLVSQLMSYRGNKSDQDTNMAAANLACHLSSVLHCTETGSGPLEEVREYGRKSGNKK